MKERRYKLTEKMRLTELFAKFYITFVKYAITVDEFMINT